MLFFRLLGIVLTLTIIAACDTAEEKPFRIGAINWPGYAPLFLLKHQPGISQENIHVIQLPSASEVIHAMRMGNLEAAALTLDETLSLVQDDFALTILLIFDFSNGADAIIAKTSVTDLVDLKGKSIAVESTAVGAVMLDSALSAAGLQVSDIKTINCEYSLHQKCFENADAIVTFEPMKSLLESKGGHVVFDSSAIPGKIVDVLVVRSELVANNQERIAQLVAAHFIARDELLQHTADANRYLRATIGLSNTELETALRGMRLPDFAENRQWLSAAVSEAATYSIGEGHNKNTEIPASPPIIQNAHSLSELLYQQQLLRKRPSLKYLSVHLTDAELKH